MKIHNKRICFTINIMISIVVGIIMNNKKGFYMATLVAIFPMIILFYLNLFFPKEKNKDEISNEFKALSKKEKIIAIVDAMLLIVFVVVQVKCLYTIWKYRGVRCMGNAIELKMKCLKAVKIKKNQRFL